MNNTSAYANVLLKPSVAAPVVAATKREYQDDFSPAKFHQTLKDVHERQQGQNEKTNKSASHKKTAQVEHHNDAKRTKEVKDAKTTRDTVAEQKPVDSPTNINQNTTGNNAVHKQPEQHKDANKFTDESDQDGISLGVEPNSDISQGAPQEIQIVSTSAHGMNLGLGAELATSTSELAAEMVTAIEPNTIQDAVISDQATTSPLLKSATEIPVSANSIALEIEGLASVTLGTDVSVEVAKSSDVVEPLLVSDGSPQNPSQPLADHSHALTVNQGIHTETPVDVQVLAAGVMAAAKPLASQIALAEMSEVSDDVIDLLTPSMPEAPASTKVTSTSNLVATNATASSEATATQMQMSASTATFEKTLQAVVSPDASLADDMAAPALNSSSTSSATNPLMDSFMRGADQQSPAARNFVVQTTVPVPVGQPQWSQAVGEKVLWLAAQNVSSAEINLHPKDLGPMQVRVSVNQEQTTVSFTSHHAVVREVLDQNLNRLRDMFSEQGLNLVNVDVSDKSFSRRQGDAQDQKAQGGSQDVASEEETVVAMSAIVQQRLVDHYA